MAGVMKTIALPHGTIPTQMFGNVNLQNAMMYVNENFAEIKNSVNESATSVNEALSAKAEADHSHDDEYAALEHTHGQSEITGLSSALDGKADLNHEHTQYLTSLPAHYHSTSEIGGLDERLQQKAEKTHSHAMAQIEGLTSEIGLKASTAYVDQQINSVGSSIKTIADNEINKKSSEIGSSQTGCGSFPGIVDGQPPAVLWTAGGNKGAVLELVFKGAKIEIAGSNFYDLETCKITISKMGTITKIEQVANGGIEIEPSI